MQKDGERETLDEQFRFSYPSTEEDFSEIVERRYGRVITRGQTNVAADHEEGPGDQNCQTEEGKTVSVGHPSHDRTETRRPSQRSAWFLDETREIQADPGGTG
jgi:DNA replication initiation complex subunit (GINS family)